MTFVQDRSENVLGGLTKKIQEFTKLDILEKKS